jgi:hypothetical protein
VQGESGAFLGGESRTNSYLGCSSDECLAVLMFCPRCGTQDKLEQVFCRQCGQSLSGVRLAVQGSPVKSLEALKAGEKLIHGGGNTITVFALAALAISIISVFLTGATYNISIIINLLLGLAIGIPLTLVGRAKLKRATQLLSQTQQESGPSLPDRTPESVEQLTDLEADLYSLPAQGSVTEHTTLDLNDAGRVRNKRS